MSFHQIGLVLIPNLNPGLCFNSDCFWPSLKCFDLATFEGQNNLLDGAFVRKELGVLGDFFPMHDGLLWIDMSECQERFSGFAACASISTVWRRRVKRMNAIRKAFMKSHKIGMSSFESTRGVHVLYRNRTLMFGHFDLHWIYRIYILSLCMSILCVFITNNISNTMFDTFSIFLRISDSAIKDQIFSNKKCKQKLPYWGSNKETP